MGVDYSANFGIGVKVKINEDKLPSTAELENGFDGNWEDFLDCQLKNTNFQLMRYGNAYSGQYCYCLILKESLNRLGLNLEPYKNELYQWLETQEYCEAVGEFDVVGGAYIW